MKTVLLPVFLLLVIPRATNAQHSCWYNGCGDASCADITPVGADFNFNCIVLRESTICHPAYPQMKDPYMDTWGGRTDSTNRCDRTNHYLCIGYGDNYPQDLIRENEDIVNYFTLEGPGNTNPGNAWSDRIHGMPDEMMRYISQQFKYVLFDVESFATRSDLGTPGTPGTPIEFIPALYHDQATALQSRNEEMTVLVYFAAPVVRYSRPHFPWWDERFMLLGRDRNPIIMTDGNVQSVVMDMRDPEYRHECVRWIKGNYSGYKGILLDNMTEYPLVGTMENFNNLPWELQKEGVWRQCLIEFVNELKQELPNLKIFCSSLGPEDASSYPPVWGTSHGVELITTEAVTGGLLESFQSTAWESLRETAIEIMTRLNDAGKVFLTHASYTREVDSCINKMFNLGRPDGKYYRVTGAPEYDMMAAWNPVFFRMQHSYLARFLMGVPIVTNPGAEFAFSFQPGFWRDQFIPYYKIWNERFGRPVEEKHPVDHDYCKFLPDTQDTAHGRYIYNARGRLYRRDFENCRVYVNITRSTSNCDAETCWFPVAVEIEPGYRLHNMDNNTPGGPYIYGKYYDSVKTRDGIKRFVILNRNEGIVLFRTRSSPLHGMSLRAPTQQEVGRTKLLGCYPNPANPRTTIAFELSIPSHVKIELFNLLGQNITTIADADYGGGFHGLPFDATKLSSGVYFYRFQAYDALIQQKLIIIK